MYFDSVEEAEASGYVRGREIGNYPRINKKNAQLRNPKETSEIRNNKRLPETGSNNIPYGVLGAYGLAIGLWLTKRNEKVNKRYKRF